jgi:hypothetical protein
VYTGSQLRSTDFGGSRKKIEDQAFVRLYKGYPEGMRDFWVSQFYADLDLPIHSQANTLIPYSGAVLQYRDLVNLSGQFELDNLEDRLFSRNNASSSLVNGISSLKLKRCFSTWFLVGKTLAAINIFIR